ncbi:hypothetical protein J1N35_035269 [Gossypium stocksii]|uniref:Uncharacterized protein n=1 Tax=Gossypium stocksii TaxID=47602 RepID=A0A9D3ZQT4_9ROSI|nr:hypothetical protein J1N35_035269 [Gossypium stocksii]
MGSVKEIVEVVEGHTNESDSMIERLREYMAEALNSNLDVMKGPLNTTMDDQNKKLNKRDDALKFMIITLKKETKAMISRIEELDVCRVVVGKGILASIPKQRIDTRCCM